MRGYRVFQQDGKWFFHLIPSNSNKQEVGCSALFDSYDECVQAVAAFRSMVIEKQINTLDHPNVKTVKGDREAHFEYWIDGKLIFQSRDYKTSSPITSCKKSIKSIHEHIDGYTLKQLFR